jgi:hypothetical protein
MRHILIAEDLDDKLATAPDANLVEHRLEVILDGTRGNSRRSGQLDGRHSLADESGDRAFLSSSIGKAASGPPAYPNSSSQGSAAGVPGQPQGNSP